MYLCREGGVSYLCSPQVRRLRREDHHPVHNSSRLVSTQRRYERRGGGEEGKRRGVNESVKVIFCLLFYLMKKTT